MPAPPVQLFLTTIASAPALRQKQEYLLRILQVKKIPFVSYDLASDPNAKRLWRRRAPKEQQALPGILVGRLWPGSFEQFEEAVERGNLEHFLLQDQDYDEDMDGKILPSQPIGVPGAAMPLDMTGQKPSFAPGGPSPMAKPGEAEIIDAGEALPGYGLQGLKVTMDELANLAKELGLNDKDSAGLAKGIKAAGKSAAKANTGVPTEEPETSKEVNEEQKQDEIKVEEPAAPVVKESNETEKETEKTSDAPKEPEENAATTADAPETKEEVVKAEAS